MDMWRWRWQHQQFNISSPYGPVIKLNCHSVGRINCAFVPILRPYMARPVYPTSRGLAQFIDKIDVPSTLRDKRQTWLSSCAPFHTQKLTREIEHWPWLSNRSLRDDNSRNNPLHHWCPSAVIIERPRRSGCSDAVESRVMTCHDSVAYSRIIERPRRSRCSDVVDSRVMTCHDLGAHSWPRRRRRLHSFDCLRRLENP